MAFAELPPAPALHTSRDTTSTIANDSSLAVNRQKKKDKINCQYTVIATAAIAASDC